MKERKKMTGFVQDTIVPEIVNRKCREAYDIIYSECRQKNKNITMKVCNEENKPDEEVYRNCEHAEGKINIKKIISVASCAAVLAAGLLIPMTWASLPTLKDSINNSEPKSEISNSEQESTFNNSKPENKLDIPEPESAFTFITQNSYLKELQVKSDLTPYADSVYKTSGNENDVAEVTLQSVYCDSFNLAVSLSLTVKNKELFKNTTNLEAYCDVLLNGISIEKVPERRTMGFIGGGDGNYYAALYYPTQDIQDGAGLEIKISDIYGTNAYKQIGDVNPIDNSVCYNPEKTISINDEYDFVHTIKVDTSHNKLYKVNETYDDVELTEIMVTPFMTGLEITQTETHSIALTDQNGDWMDYIGGPDGKWYFSSPYKTSEILNVELHRIDMDDFPIEYTFEVPIDEGFAEKNTVDYNNSIIDHSKIVYDPPMEELEEENRTNNQILYEKIKSEVIPEPAGTEINEYYSYENYLEWTITNYDVADAADYEHDIDNDWGIEQYKNDYGSLDGARIIFITCEIENPYNYSVSETLAGPTIISKDLFNLPDSYSWFNEYHYVSYKENYGKTSYAYEFAPYETKTITYGYVVPQEYVDAGYWACFWGKNGHSANDLEDILCGNATLCEIN